MQNLILLIESFGLFSALNVSFLEISFASNRIFKFKFCACKDTFTFLILYENLIQAACMKLCSVSMWWFLSRYTKLTILLTIQNRTRNIWLLHAKCTIWNLWQLKLATFFKSWLCNEITISLDKISESFRQEKSDSKFVWFAKPKISSKIA